jgi:hypothetical protein
MHDYRSANGIAAAVQRPHAQHKNSGKTLITAVLFKQNASQSSPVLGFKLCEVDAIDPAKYLGCEQEHCITEAILFA